ncbi:hypothetical protein ACTSKR_09475 [Chitinibacteraceae bacterium HSL-7]
MRGVAKTVVIGLVVGVGGMLIYDWLRSRGLSAVQPGQTPAPLVNIRQSPFGTLDAYDRWAQNGKTMYI